MMHYKKFASAIKTTGLIFSIALLLTNCGNQESDEEFDYIQPFPVETQTESAIPNILGDWQLDKVVFVTNGIEGEAQAPFSPTTWTFTEKGQYLISVQKKEFALSTVKDGVAQESSLRAKTPSQNYQGRYRQKSDELNTSILGGNTKYQIVEHTDTSLKLRSQRVQVPPISKEDEGKLAFHYFTIKSDRESVN